MTRAFDAGESSEKVPGHDLRLAIVAARFNGPITERLLEGALRGLRSNHVRDENVDVLWVPGAFEIPFTAKVAAETGRYDAIVCLGAVIRGETAHFDFVAGGAASGIMQVGLETGVPTSFGVLTTESVEQALARSESDDSNKGFEAAETALAMVGLKRRV